MPTESWAFTHSPKTRQRDIYTSNIFSKKSARNFLHPRQRTVLRLIRRLLRGKMQELWNRFLEKGLVIYLIDILARFMQILHWSLVVYACSVEHHRFQTLYKLRLIVLWVILMLKYNSFARFQKVVFFILGGALLVVVDSFRVGLNFCTRDILHQELFSKKNKST